MRNQKKSIEYNIHRGFFVCGIDVDAHSIHIEINYVEFPIVSLSLCLYKSFTRKME